MKALVAGGAGFIGSHWIDALVSEGHQVAFIVNFFIGTRTKEIKTLHSMNRIFVTWMLFQEFLTRKSLTISFI